MANTLLFAIITITLALIFYTIGVWSEHKVKVLKKWHIVIFWLGLIFDTLGTSTMTIISRSNTYTVSASKLSIHSVTGGLAIILMFFHALWASWVILKNDERAKSFFHKFSLAVWIIWLIPYFIGMFMGMNQ